VEDRQIELRFSKEEFVWKMLGDSMENREMLLPKEMELLVKFMKVQKNYSGSNTEFCERYNEYAGQAVSARGLKRLMNLWEYRLADFGSSRLCKIPKLGKKVSAVINSVYRIISAIRE